MAKKWRKFLIAGNWKMNKTPSESRQLLQDLLRVLSEERHITILICPPFTALATASELLQDSSIALGAQNLYPERFGAFTGEISPLMLRDLYVSHVILGHSERRDYFQESNAFINCKVRAALENRLIPILCVGETLAQRDDGQAFAIIDDQLAGGLNQVAGEEMERLVIAYEPIWAIGTGKTASSAAAQEMHGHIRQWLQNRYGAELSDRVRILYGGSLKADNAQELLQQPDIDGGLIGGASLNAVEFTKIVEIAKDIEESE